MLFQKTSRGVGVCEGNSALIWLDLAKIPNWGWSAVLVVSEQLTLSLYHGNNLLLKPRKQINYGKDISRCHYGVIRKNISIQHAGQWCRQKRAVCECGHVCDHLWSGQFALNAVNPQTVYLFVFSQTPSPFFFFNFICVFAFLFMSMRVRLSSVQFWLNLYACLPALLWDCRTTSRVLNNESKHGREAKSHCRSFSLNTDFTLAQLDDWCSEDTLSIMAMKYRQYRSTKHFSTKNSANINYQKMFLCSVEH